MQKAGKVFIGIVVAIVTMNQLVFWMEVSNNRRLERLREAEERYQEKIEKYLEKKYGGEFHVNPEYEYTCDSSPMPRANGTYEYEAYDGEGYVLSVKLRPVSGSDPTISSLRDNYIWRTLSVETEEWFKEELSDILPEEYKAVCIINGPYLHDYPSAWNTTLEEYLGGGYGSNVLIYIIAPSGVWDEDFTEDAIYPALEKFYILSGKRSKIRFRYYSLDSYEQYKSIDTKQLKNWYFTVEVKESPVDAISQYKTMEIEIQAA